MQLKSLDPISATLAVFTCGPSEMSEHCRMVVYSVMKTGISFIEYIEDSFGW